ncbi:MAG: sugar ABC transporter substrate-binding protein [Anaerolineae bacterium]|nr:sugar ABC transporter substrate-binding protein [Anaerolineae bacterium]
MLGKKLSRREFLKISSAAAALAASGANINSILRAAPLLQDKVNIVFGGWGATAEDNGVQAAIKVFQEENANISVEWQITPSAADYMQQLLTNFAAGTAPDTSFIVADAYETLRVNGQLMDITDRIKNDELLGKADYFIQPQESARCADSEGHWHGIGSCWVSPHIYYNADILAEAGVTPPGFKDDEIWDWDTFVANAKKLTVDANGKHPDEEGFDPENIQRWAIDWPLWWIPIASAVHSNGGEFITADGKIGLDSPEALEAMQRLSDLIYVHHVAPRSAALSDLGMTNTQMIDSGRLAMGVDGSWALSWMNPSLLKVKMGTGALPKMKKPAAIMQAHFHSVISSTQHPEEAWQWVRFLATPFYQTQFCKIGLWLPSQTALTTEDGLKTWITEGVHPANYSQFVTDYLPKYGVAPRIPSGYIEADANFITPAFQALAAGTPAAEAMTEAVKQANDVIAAAQKK